MTRVVVRAAADGMLVLSVERTPFRAMLRARRWAACHNACSGGPLCRHPGKRFVTWRTEMNNASFRAVDQALAERYVDENPQLFEALRGQMLMEQVEAPVDMQDGGGVSVPVRH